LEILRSLDPKSATKYALSDGTLTTRIRSPKDTINDIIPLSSRIGITRISDITYMDKLYIPNYSIILPSTEDSIWVYSGKGPTKADAKASGLMEAIERYSALSSTYSRSFIQGTFSDLSKSYPRVLHPLEVLEPNSESYGTEESILDFVQGYDLLKKERILVPAELVLSRYSPLLPSTSAFLYSHTNGLASGNVLEEAVCHALCEVIERDAISIADLCASSLPYTILEQIRNSLVKAGMNEILTTKLTSEPRFMDDSSIFPDVEITELAERSEPIRDLVMKFKNEKVSLMIKDITQKDIGIPTFVASSVEWMSEDYGFFALGYGTHPDIRIALIRAITEVSQTRAGNIQGARDDLKKIHYNENDEIYKRKWQFMPSQLSRNTIQENTLQVSNIRSYQNKDVLDDIKLILDRLQKAGLKRAIIVDLTHPEIGIPVVRAIVPGLEIFEISRLFTTSELFMGNRAKDFFLKVINRY
jgi:thioglycine synthase